MCRSESLQIIKGTPTRILQDVLCVALSHVLASTDLAVFGQQRTVGADHNAAAHRFRARTSAGKLHRHQDNKIMQLHAHVLKTELFLFSGIEPGWSQSRKDGQTWQSQTYFLGITLYRRWCTRHDVSPSPWASWLTEMSSLPAEKDSAKNAQREKGK